MSRPSSRDVSPVSDKDLSTSPPPVSQALPRPTEVQDSTSANTFSTSKTMPDRIPTSAPTQPAPSRIGLKPFQSSTSLHSKLATVRANLAQKCAYIQSLSEFAKTTGYTGYPISMNNSDNGYELKSEHCNQEQKENERAQEGGQVDVAEIVRHARQIHKTHIKQLNEYNQIRDAAMVLLECIAEDRGMRLSEVLEERGIDMKE